MIDRDLLLKDLKKQTAELADDLRTRTDEVEEIRQRVHGQYEEARTAGRTDRSYEEWREDLLAQVAVGWVLATVFVRFSEDNGLYATPLLSGPGDRREVAGDHRAAWLARNPAAGDREWLEEVVGRYRAIPATGELFGEHNALWQFGPSADGAKALVELWRQVDTETGEPRHDFTDDELDTRFLGDLYQDLSEHAKKTYALLQTPEFVEEFILERTLDPAIETFGLDEVRMIDPTCGSGHFLLGAFDRILGRWREREPGTPIRELVQRTLDAVNGVDLNPFAVEIARFRLLVAALKAAEVRELADAPTFGMRIAVGDSLIHGRRSGRLFSGGEEFGPLLKHRYPTEDPELAGELLEPSRYHAVVGNPPYITVKDAGLRDAYRALYDTAFYKYSLAVPLTERFFDLAQASDRSREGGFVGLITTNTFMKRSFGRKLVEEFLPTIDLTHILDTSGAHIPDHGTPTVILFGRHQKPASTKLRAVLGVRAEPKKPECPARGRVWTSIVNLVDQPGEENEYVSVEEMERDCYYSHPWSLQGGAAPDLKSSVEEQDWKLDAFASAIGFTGISGSDALMLHSPGVANRLGLDLTVVLPLVDGQGVRDWRLSPGLEAYFPYQGGVLVDIRELPGWLRVLWPYRTLLGGRPTFSKRTYVEEGRPWWEWHQVAHNRLKIPLSITFAFVATHNNFVLDGGGKVFKQSAPVIKLPDGSTYDDHLNLLGLLDSSVGCFWMKQVLHDKGGGGIGGGIASEEWERFYEFDGTKLKQFPIPARAPLERARQLDTLAQRLTVTVPAAVVESAPPTRERLHEARDRADAIRARMVALQEELDWECYHLYGLTDEELTLPSDQVPDLEKGERAFEIVLARKMAAGEAESTWFKRHGSTPITELPGHWPEAYRRLVERRIELIRADRSIRLLEKPEHKRRWNWDAWEDLEQAALERWLLARLEEKRLWADPVLLTTARLADGVRRDPDFVEAAHLYSGRRDVDLTEVVTGLVKDQSVPFAVGYRFKPSGLRRRREWEKVWELQRKEDAIDARTELPEDDPDHLTPAAAEREKKAQGLHRISVPPKYRKSDYSDDISYRLRGKLDVPQERFILYPGTRKGADSTPVIGWAGWDHLQQAQALAGHFTTRKDEGADAPELTSLLAGLQELVPWLRQWHNDMDPTYGQRMGDFFASFVEAEARSLGETVDELRTAHVELMERGAL